MASHFLLLGVLLSTLGTSIVFAATNSNNKYHQVTSKLDLLAISVDRLSSIIEIQQGPVALKIPEETLLAGFELLRSSQTADCQQTTKPPYNTYEEQLKTKVDNLIHDVAVLKKSLQQSAQSAVFFSVTTSKRVECFSCIVTYDVVNTLSHQNAFRPERGIFIAPISGIYFFTFHALAEAGQPVKVQLVVNEKPRAYIYDRDVSGSNNRFAMVSQSLMVPMAQGDQFYALLHEGALKGGGISHTFTSLVGFRIGPNADNSNIL